MKKRDYIVTYFGNVGEDQPLFRLDNVTEDHVRGFVRCLKEFKRERVYYQEIKKLTSTKGDLQVRT